MSTTKSHDELLARSDTLTGIAPAWDAALRFLPAGSAGESRSEAGQGKPGEALTVDDADPHGDPGSSCSIWFMGDLADPWVEAIAEALPDGTIRVVCPDELPDSAFGSIRGPAVVVIHRAILTRPDFERLARLRARASPPPRVVLCFGPYVRHSCLDRWAEVVDVALPEATARDTLTRHLAPKRIATTGGALVARPKIAVISSSFAMRHALGEVCKRAGYPLTAREDWSGLPGAVPVVWDVPVLDPAWPDAMARRARGGPLIALIGFADRALVAEARARGAVACLELPVDPLDLLAVLDRVLGARHDRGHSVPPQPVSRRRAASPPPVVDRRRKA
jgi:hypothetical protein